MPKTHQKEIKKITKQIVENYHPEKIILFGSYAWGKPDENSDVDLLVIKETEEDPWKRLKKISDYLDADYPTDVLVYTPREVRKRLSINDFFVKKIIDKGKIIYEERL